MDAGAEAKVAVMITTMAHAQHHEGGGGIGIVAPITAPVHQDE